MSHPTAPPDSLAPQAASREPSLVSTEAGRVWPGALPLLALAVSTMAFAIALGTARPWSTRGAASPAPLLSAPPSAPDAAASTGQGATGLGTAAPADGSGSSPSGPMDPAVPDAPPTLPLRFVAQALLAAPGPKQRAMVIQVAHHPIEQVVNVLRRFLTRADLERDAAFEAIYWLKLHGSLGTRTLLQLYPDLEPWRQTIVVEIFAVYRNEADPDLIREMKVAYEDAHYERWEKLRTPIPRTVGSGLSQVLRPGPGCPCHPR